MSEKNNFIAITAKIILAVVCIAAACIPGIYVAHIGAQPFDEPYQILNALDYKNVPFAPLSNLFGHIFGTHFGYEWLTFRYLGLGLCLLSVLMGCVYYLCKTHNYKVFLICTTFLVLIVGCYRLCFSIYGWDSWSTFTLVATLILTIEYLNRKSVWLLVAIALLSAVAIACRVPNAVILPLMVVIIYANIDASQRLRHSAIYLVVAIAATLAILCAIYGSLVTYLCYLRDNTVDSHDIISVIAGHINGVARNLSYIAMIVVAYYLLQRAKTKAQKIILLIGFAYTLLLNVCNRITPFHSSTLDLHLASVLMLLGTAYYMHRGTATGRKLLAITLIAIVPIAGSNTGIYKFIMLPIVPILLMYVQGRLNREMRIIGGICFASILIFAPVGTRRFSYNDEGYKRATYTYNHTLAKGLKTAPNQGEYTIGIIDALQPYQKKYRILVLRRDYDYIYEYLLQERNGYLRHRFDGVSPDDKDYVAYVAAQIAAARKASPAKKPLAVLYFGGESEMTKLLDRSCHKEIDGDGFTFYVMR
jgi:hypothetical protein